MYSTAKEFANAVKKDLYEYEMEAEDITERLKALSSHYEEVIKEFPDFRLHKEFDALTTKFQEVIDNLLVGFYTIIPEDVKAKFEHHFYFTTIDNKSIGAHIRRSSDKKFFGVFINSSLINLLTKIGKLDAALLNPECVVFCSRFPDSRPTVDDIRNMRDELFNYFMTYKMAQGAFLVIKGTEASTHFSRLNIQEKFILFHEIAHFLNGDLFESRDEQKLIHPFNSIKHQREHLADILAFALVLWSENVSGKISKEHSLFIMSAIIHLFDVMAGLQQQEGESHPYPLNRMNAIIEGYWGVEIAELIERTYYEKGVWEELIASPPELKFNIDSIKGLVDTLLKEAFDGNKWL